jgi:hypothetical protein
VEKSAPTMSFFQSKLEANIEKQGGFTITSDLSWFKPLHLKDLHDSFRLGTLENP